MIIRVNYSNDYYYASLTLRHNIIRIQFEIRDYFVIVIYQLLFSSSVRYRFVYPRLYRDCMDITCQEHYQVYRQGEMLCWPPATLLIRLTGVMHRRFQHHKTTLTNPMKSHRWLRSRQNLGHRTVRRFRRKAQETVTCMPTFLIWLYTLELFPSEAALKSSPQETPTNHLLIAYPLVLKRIQQIMAPQRILRSHF